MTDNHKELCDWFRREAYEYDNGDNYRSAFLKAAALIESQAKQIAGYVEQHGRDSAELRRLCAARDEANARARQQALEYVSLFDQCGAQLARIAELEKDRDALKADAERYRWLRDFGKDGVNLKPPCEQVYTLLYSHPVGVIPASRVIAGDELDRAIEAAMEKSDARS